MFITYLAEKHIKERGYKTIYSEFEHFLDPLFKTLNATGIVRPIIYLLVHGSLCAVTFSFSKFSESLPTVLTVIYTTFYNRSAFVEKLLDTHVLYRGTFQCVHSQWSELLLSRNIQYAVYFCSNIQT